MANVSQEPISLTSDFISTKLSGAHQAYLESLGSKYAGFRGWTMEADSPDEGGKPNEGEGEGNESPKTYTQEELNQAVAARVEEVVRDRLSGAHKELTANLANAQTDAEAKSTALTEAQNALATITSELEVKDKELIKYRVSFSKGLTPADSDLLDKLKWDTEDELSAAVDAVLSRSAGSSVDTKENFTAGKEYNQPDLGALAEQLNKRYENKT